MAVVKFVEEMESAKKNLNATSEKEKLEFFETFTTVIEKRTSAIELFQESRFKERRTSKTK
jgi:hypothetical protein